MKTTVVPDPFTVLEVSHEADDDQIRKAFHQKIREFPDKMEIREAYELIRNENNRKSWRWLHLSSFITPPPKLEEKTVQNFTQEELNALVKELAFLSDWELGEEGSDG